MRIRLSDDPMGRGYIRWSDERRIARCPTGRHWYGMVSGRAGRFPTAAIVLTASSDDPIRKVFTAPPDDFEPEKSQMTAR